jgi:hypothetical protein
MRDDSQRPAWASEIRGILGDVEDLVIARIVLTEASLAEVSQAAQWFRGGGLEDEAGHEPHGTVRAVYEILMANEPLDEP